MLIFHVGLRNSEAEMVVRGIHLLSEQYSNDAMWWS